MMKKMCMKKKVKKNKHKINTQLSKEIIYKFPFVMIKKVWMNRRK